MSSQTLAGIALIPAVPAWIAGYVYHLLGYRSGGRYDTKVQSH